MVSFLGNLISLIGCIILLALFKFFHKFWWIPMCIKYVMSSQGIRGPPYSFFHGNTKEISVMKNLSMSSPMETSHNIFPRIQPHIDSWFHVYGKIFLYWLGPEAELVVKEPALLKEIMSDGEISMGKPDMPLIFKKLLGGLASSEGDKWAQQRKLANHAFHAERLKNMVPVMIESVDIMLKRWKDNGAKQEVYEEFKILTSDVISRTAFGSSYEEGKQLFQKLGALNLLASKNMNMFNNGLFVFWNIFKDKDDIESDKLQADIHDLIVQMIRNKENMKISGNEESSPNDYLGLLLKAHHDFDGIHKLSIQDIIDDCKTFYTAGHRTVSLLLSWVTLLLGINTDWQEKARMEVQKVFGNKNPSSEGIGKLKIMGMIINETLRLYSPVVAIVRKVRKETKVGNLIFPANINVQIPVLALHQDPEIWGKDAHLFKPERFSEGIAKATNNNPRAFLAFGYGPRYCVGSSFAITEAKITLSMILQRYRFTKSPTYVHEPVQMISLRPKSGIQIMFQAL